MEKNKINLVRQVLFITIKKFSFYIIFRLFISILILHFFLLSQSWWWLFLHKKQVSLFKCKYVKNIIHLYDKFLLFRYKLKMFVTKNWNLSFWIVVEAWEFFNFPFFPREFFHQDSPPYTQSGLLRMLSKKINHTETIFPKNFAKKYQIP